MENLLIFQPRMHYRLAVQCKTGFVKALLIKLKFLKMVNLKDISPFSFYLFNVQPHAELVIVTRNLRKF